MPSNDGSDWSLGTPSALNGMVGVHDAQADFDGNLWITYSLPSYDTTIARIDAKTGAVKKFRLDDTRGFAAGSHGMTRDENGMLWFNTRSNVARMHGGLGKIDPRSGQLSVYVPRAGQAANSSRSVEVEIGAEHGGEDEGGYAQGDREKCDCEDIDHDPPPCYFPANAGAPTGGACPRATSAGVTAITKSSIPADFYLLAARPAALM